MKYLKWEELSKKEQEQATETYFSIREEEECRLRNETNDDYPFPMNASILPECLFIRNNNGYVDIVI